MTAKRKAKPKPKPCKGCAHYRSETGSRGGEEICHYILDTGKPRGACRKIVISGSLGYRRAKSPSLKQKLKNTTYAAQSYVETKNARSLRRSDKRCL